MSTVIRSSRNASIDVPKGASGSGGKRPRKGNGGRRPPRDKPVIGKDRQVDACALCKSTDHKMDKCPHRAAFLDWMRSVPASEAPVQQVPPPSYQAQYPPRPRDCRHPNRPVRPAPQRRPRHAAQPAAQPAAPARQRRPPQEGPRARDRHRAIWQARREDPEQAPEREEPPEDIEEEPQERLQREREQTGELSQATRQDLRLDSPADLMDMDEDWGSQ